ncbi:MAG: DCC1-like thiol-disulfide oxidoreductase family protein [Litorimonas sp.]
MTISIYYDGECPFCAKYVSFLRLKEAVGSVDLVNLRDHSEKRDEFISQGYDVDQGMVVDMNGKLSFGTDAVNQLALLSTPSGIFNKINKFLFSSTFLAALLYPILKAGRWLVLFLLGRDQLNPTETAPHSRATIFASLFALFSLFHFFNYSLEYGRFSEIEYDLLFVVFSAILLFVKPDSPRLLFLLMFASTISAIAQAPISSNHTIVRNFVLLGYWISFGLAMIRGSKRSDIFTNFTTSGQAVLVIMYFFGVFHKINTDFLDPTVSCATALWQDMPWPLHLIDHPFMYYLAIYGTFIVEGALLLMLFNRRTRHIAVVFGILFHLMLGMSNFSMYISFTTLAIALHCLFLNDESATNIQNSDLMRTIRNRVRSPLYLFAAVVLALIAATTVYLTQQYSIMTMFMIPFLGPFCYAIIRHGSSKEVLLGPENRRSANTIGVVVGVLFFINCWAPFLGLKTAQSVNMFANLRLEGGVSNHLIMKAPPGPAQYLEDLVKIQGSEGGKIFKFYEGEDRAMVYYELLARLSDNPEVSVTYIRAGILYEDMTAETLSDEIETTLHPKWVRKWFHFKNVDLQTPKTCAR